MSTTSRPAEGKTDSGGGTRTPEHADHHSSGASTAETVVSGDPGVTPAGTPSGGGPGLGVGGPLGFTAPEGHERLRAPLQLRGHHRPPASAPAMARTRSGVRPTTRPTSSSATPAAHASRISASRWASAASCSLRAQRSRSPAAASAAVTFARSVITTSPTVRARSPRPRARPTSLLRAAARGRVRRPRQSRPCLENGSYGDAEVVAYGHRATERAAELSARVAAGAAPVARLLPEQALDRGRPTRAPRALLHHSL